MAVIWQISILIWLCYEGIAQAVNREALLRKTLSRDHELKLRPVEDFTDAVRIKLRFNPLLIMELDEAKQILSLFCWVSMNWNLFNVTWDPSEHGNITFLDFEATEVWTPDMSIINSVENPISILDTKGRYGRLHSDGLFYISLPGVINVICLLDITFYPFDEQVCHVEFDSWTLPLEQLDIAGSESLIHLKFLRPNCQWNLEESWIHEKISQGATSSFKTVSFVMRLRRKPLYLVLNLVLPFLGLMLLQLVMFYVPPDEGEKISVGITLLLSKTVFLLMMQGNMPETSDQTPILAIFIFLDMLLTGMEIICCTIVIQYYHNSPAKIRSGDKILLVLALGCKIKNCREEKELSDIDWKAFIKKLDSLFFTIFATVTIIIVTALFLLFYFGPVKKEEPLAGYGYDYN